MDNCIIRGAIKTLPNVRYKGNKIDRENRDRRYADKWRST